MTADSFKALITTGFLFKADFIRGRITVSWRSSQPHAEYTRSRIQAHKLMWIKTFNAVSTVCESSHVWVCSPKTHQTKSESPGQDEGHPEVHILRRSLLILQFIFKTVEPDVLEAHFVLQAVACVWPVKTRAERKAKPICCLHFTPYFLFSRSQCRFQFHKCLSQWLLLVPYSLFSLSAAILRLNIEIKGVIYHVRACFEPQIYGNHLCSLNNSLWQLIPVHENLARKCLWCKCWLSRVKRQKLLFDAVDFISSVQQDDNEALTLLNKTPSALTALGNTSMRFIHHRSIKEA